MGAKILKVASPFYAKFTVNEDGKTCTYYFKTWEGKGKKGANVDVPKLDYAAMRENPLFIRIIQDEVVEVAQQQYLGKIHVKLLPGFFVTIGYFSLTEQPQETTANTQFSKGLRVAL
ncbi:MAG: hypothetical protein M3X11_17995 [Acidobacteriota bacterium]|nr:hypothetical protein [Acidobacteriota bacterium]